MVAEGSPSNAGYRSRGPQDTGRHPPVRAPSRPRRAVRTPATQIASTIQVFHEPSVTVSHDDGCPQSGTVSGSHNAEAIAVRMTRTARLPRNHTATAGPTSHHAARIHPTGATNSDAASS